MRKNYRRKRRSCALCKPHKVGWDSRWTAKEAALRKALDLERQRASHEDCIDLIDAQAALEETKTVGAKPLDQIIKELGH